MNILVLSTKYTHDDGSPWLASELCSALSQLGHDLTVINVQWSDMTISDFEFNKNIKFYNFKAIKIFTGYRISTVFRWLFSSFKVLPLLFSKFLHGYKFDLLISFSPCTSLYAAIPFAKFICKDSCLIYWDFFPIHNQEITKKIPPFVLPILKRIENFLINRFARVGLMSRANLDFFNLYFRYYKKLSIIPIWTSNLNSNIFSLRKLNSKFDALFLSDRINYVFGGQLTNGRGVIELCLAIINAHKINNKINLIICGSGDLKEEVLKLERCNPNVIKYLGSLSRGDYNLILNRCDVGVVVTVSGVSSPTFPSKSLDYMAACLPIFAALEKSSDFGSLLMSHRAGFFCDAGNIQAMTECILSLARSKFERIEMGMNGNRYLKENHSLTKVIPLIIGDSCV